jgi:hypothetical protein
MRPRALITATLASIALVGTLSGCGSSAVVVSGPLAQAAYVTGHVGGAHMQLNAQIEGSGLPQAVTMNGGGFFNFRSHEGSFSIELSGLPTALAGSAPTMQELFKGSNLYIGSSLLTGKLPGGAQWMKVDLAKVGAAAGFDPSQLLSGQSNPAEVLEYLKASGASVTIVGHDRIRGVPTTHYSAQIDLAKAAAALAGANAGAARKAIGELGVSELPVEVWVDSHNLVRRVQLSLHTPSGSQAPQIQMQMSVELFNFGTTPTVSVPPPSETFDATSTALGGLGAVGQ